MKRFWVALLTVALIAAAMTGSIAEGAIEIQIWHTFTEGQEVALNEIADAFNASQSEYFVNVQSQEYSGFTNKVYNAVATGTGPNIIFNYGSEAAKYVPDGLVLDMTSYINDAEIGMKEIVDSMSARVLSDEVLGFDDGGIYYLPAYTTGPIIFYNATMFAELELDVPTTWEELEFAAKTIYEAKGVPGFAVDSLTDLVQTFILQSGSTYIDTAAKTIGFNTEKVAALLDWFGSCVQKGWFALTPSGNYWSNDFNTSLCGFYYGSCAGAPYISPEGFEYDVAPAVRGMEDGTEWYPSWNRGPIAFKSETEAEDKGTYLFIRYFLQPENNFKWVQATATLSPYGTTQALEGYDEYAALNAALVAVAANLDIAGALPNVTGSSAVRDALKEVATNVGYGTAAAEALAAAETTCNTALAGK